MAKVDIDIAGRRYAVACRDGEEEHLHALGAIVAAKAHDAAGALGTLSENRQLLLASLLLADELKERRAAVSAGPAPHEDDPAVADALERLAARMESLADRLEGGRANP
ncbi:MAG TPA: cell division protein ZapA [Allosphingosinicella sp.]|jgi:cell division protein ZapA|nr:cell division protein ZapA [Allosphingosinicella sp.]